MLKCFFEAKSFIFHIPKPIQVPKHIFAASTCARARARPLFARARPRFARACVRACACACARAREARFFREHGYKISSPWGGPNR